jgi:ABC-2 type transport system ATP-binding protein
MIEVRQLEKVYGSIRALDGISFSVAPGEVFGLLGHNGAGKTTTLRILSGRAKPTSGNATIGGHDVVRDFEAVKPLINVVFEEQNLYERLSGYDNLRVFADLYGAPRDRIDRLLERVGLTSAAKRKVKTYSTGMRQRLLIARALINEPRVMMLDEPTRGLDPVSAREVRSIVSDLAEADVSVLLCTHYMEEADELCDRVAFLSNGRIVAMDTPRELRLQHGQRARVRVLLDDRSEIEVDMADPIERRRLDDLVSSGRIMTIHSQEGTLEDVFVAVAGRPL